MKQTAWWGWPILVGGGLVLAGTAYRAFSAPWTWDANQSGLVFLCACFGYVAMFYARIWLRGGADGVKSHWAKVRQMKDPRLDAKAQRRRPMFWVFLLILIAFSVLSVPDVRQSLLALFR
jgi:hypothetical protein